MKKILLIIGIVFCCLMLYAQQDTVYVQQDTVITKAELMQHIKNIETDFINFNKQFSNGTSLILGGTFCSLVGIVALNMHEYEMGTIFIFGSGILILVGNILQTDAHKYIGGKRSLTVHPGGLSYKF